MSEFLDQQAVAALVSSVTKTMCGTSFVPWDTCARGESLAARMVLLPLIGERKIEIALAYDSRGARALAASLFGCAAQETTPDMEQDAVHELLNMVAGQVARLLKVDQAIGLPRATSLAEVSNDGGPVTQDAILLRSEGIADLRMWIYERLPAPIPMPAPRGNIGDRVRMLLKRLGP